MSRKEYMEQLDMLLRDIPHTERQEALKYYEDYFADAGKEHEAEVINELGSPKELAKKLREDLKRETDEATFEPEDSAEKGTAAEENTGSKEMTHSGAEENAYNQSYQNQSFQGQNFQSQNYQGQAYRNSGSYEAKKPGKGYKAATVFLIILGVLIGIGYLGRLAGGITWVRRINLTLNDESGDRGISDAEMTTVTYGKNKIKDLDIDAELGMLNIECWDEDYISVTYPEAYISLEQDGEELLLETKDKWYRFWERLFVFGDRREEDFQILMKIPKNLVFGNIDIDTGACSVVIDRLEAADINLDTGAGELTAGEMIAGELIDIDAGVGETTIEKLKAGEANFDVGVGELSVSGCVDGDISASCGVGEMRLYLTNKETDFNYSISCGVGEIDMNGTSYAGIGNDHEIDNDAEHDFDMDCGVGEIQVTFEENQI